MKNIGLWLILFLAFSALICCAEQRDDSNTIRLNASLEIYANSSTGSNDINLDEDEEFNLSVLVKCLGKPCGTVELTLFTCSGKYCEYFGVIGNDPTSPVYVREGDVTHKCFNVENRIDRVYNTTSNEPVPDDILRRMQNSFECSNSVRLRAKTPGNYSFIFQAQSTNTPTYITSPFYLNVRGCGDGVCADAETYSSCARDCCTEKCTAVYDNICHTECRGVKNCSIAPDCNNRFPGFRTCISDDLVLACCGAGTSKCDTEQFCSSGYCLNCSRKCDGVCESAKCYRTDPDCDKNGNATGACCGNGKIDLGEECESGWGLDKCETNCLTNCMCQIGTTTSTTTTSPDTTLDAPVETISSTTSISTTSTTQNSSDKTGPSSGNGFALPDLSILLPVFALILLAAGGFYVLGVFSSFKAKQDYKGARLKQEMLKKEKEFVMNKYAEGRISETDASKKILEYEEKISELETKIDKAAGKI